MSSDLIKYDYPVIEECLSMMSKKAQEIQSQTDDLGNDVKRIMVDWQGSTADSYNQIANDLRSDLEQNRANLDNLNSALHQAANDMQDQDKRGAGNIL
ncbi:WXG100 family type VII secretion target [Amycolatopsis bartoniae]|uniref:ESAT-6-like protein n=1 Tax=Amycolatopsis bartoniae TaxID=941986 RepID=A0A8H9MBD8_9PSEU|nr:WXG100 family type VII secretion target [Amycolatopsis bartoniae]MBB2934775.1 WXG100 family type VII secretion target [Amycolatopsis bartoniae]TVT02436.1 WXG100 family type VII secretion target [Amycolatopsis bartoniae]GHF44813.1 hypothetical protein GCM10017566_17310 [Amycolatopsis bartoniae]